LLPAGRDLNEKLLVVLITAIASLAVMTLLFTLLVMLLRMKNNRHALHWQKLHALWDSEILEVLSGDHEPGHFRSRVKPGQELDCVRFLIPYAHRLRGRDLDILSAIAQPYLPKVSRALRHEDAGVRIWAINAMDLFGMPRYEEAVSNALEDQEVAVSVAAASCLLGQKRVHLINSVLTQFPRYGNWNLHALTTLLARVGPSAIPVIEPVYLDHNADMRARIAAAEVMMNLNHYAVADKAAELLGKEKSIDFIVATLRLLVRVGHAAHVPAVRRFCTHANDNLRIHAIRCLRSLGTDEDISLFENALQDPNPWVAMQAARALHELDATGILTALQNSGSDRAILASQVLAEKVA
jgi:HEAT repeat protein